MNERPLHQDRFEHIEAYLLDTLSAPDRARFEEELAADPALRYEVALQRENMLAVEFGGLQGSLRNIMAMDQQMAPRATGRYPFLRYAAMLAIVAGAAIWFALRPSATDRLYAEHYTVDPGLPVPMSISDDPVFHDAMVAFKLGDFDEARTKWEALRAQEPANDTLLYYIGSAALAQNDLAAAAPLFHQVAADPTSLFADKARWYLFLICVKKDDRACITSTDLEDHPVHGEEVRAIKSTLH